MKKVKNGYAPACPEPDRYPCCSIVTLASSVGNNLSLSDTPTYSRINLMFRTRMFRRRLIENSDGYSVEFLDRASVRYKDERITVIVGIEHLQKSGDICIYQDQIWNDTKPKVLLDSKNVRIMVVARAKAALEFARFKVEVV